MCVTRRTKKILCTFKTVWFMKKERKENKKPAENATKFDRSFISFCRMMHITQYQLTSSTTVYADWRNYITMCIILQGQFPKKENQFNANPVNKMTILSLSNLFHSLDATIATLMLFKIGNKISFRCNIPHFLYVIWRALFVHACQLLSLS